MTSTANGTTKSFLRLELLFLNNALVGARMIERGQGGKIINMYSISDNEIQRSRGATT